MIDRSESWVFVTITFLLFMQFQGEIIVKVQIYSQWMEEVYVPVRVRQFAKAAKLMGKSFGYAGSIRFDKRQRTLVSFDLE